MKKIIIVGFILVFILGILFTSLNELAIIPKKSEKTVESNTLDSIYSKKEIFTEAKFSGNTNDSAQYLITIVENSWKQGCEEDDTCFTPHNKVINVGDTILFLNEDKFEHNVRVRGDPNYLHHPTDVIRQNEYFVYKFNESGKYDIHCTLHPWMEGAITVN